MSIFRVAIMCGFPQIWRVLDPLVGEKNCRAGWRVLTLVCGFSLSQLLLSKNWLFLEKSPIIFKKNFDGMKFFQKLWHKNGIKKLPRAFFECAGYVRVLNKLVCGKMCGFLENRPKSCGFYEKNYGNTGQFNLRELENWSSVIFRIKCEC